MKGECGLIPENDLPDALDDVLAALSDEALVGLSLGEAESDAPQWSAEGAFAALMDRHQAAIRRVVRAVLGNSPDVDDVVQSAFTSAFRSLGSLKDRAKFKYWVRMIAINEANDLARQRLDYLPIDELVTLPERSLGAAPVQAVEAAWMLEALNERLPAEYMKVLYLRYYLDYTVNEVAEMLGIQPGLVKWRSNRAKRLARQALKAEGVDERKEDAKETQDTQVIREGGE